MKKHERTHRGEKLFKCSDCDKSFLIAENERTDIGEKPFKCTSAQSVTSGFQDKVIEIVKLKSI